MMPYRFIVNNTILGRIEDRFKKSFQPPALFGYKEIGKKCEQDDDHGQDGQGCSQQVIEATEFLQVGFSFLEQPVFIVYTLVE